MPHVRSNGILLHTTSLPSAYGIGDLGPSAYHFADFLAYTGQKFWQVLPIVPVGYGYSPYASPSTFAGNPLLISPDRLREQGLLWEEDLAGYPHYADHYVDFEQVIPAKLGLLRKAFLRFEDGQGAVDGTRYEQFKSDNVGWLEEYGLFMSLKAAHHESSWVDWDPVYIRREPEALASAREQYAQEIRMHIFWQYLFDEQWKALKAYCNERSIRIFGDLPIYVAHDSADVWSNPHLFYLDHHGQPTVVSGVPPDYFSETGQRWGNPIYRWEAMQEDGYAWWTQRIAKILELVDLVRFDHFRGFEAYWEVPASEETAVNGVWVEGPGASLFDVLLEKLGALPVIAENLGVITPGVVTLMEQFNFPGMAILQFGFDSGPSNEFLPHNYKRNLVAYSGTHDNDTVVGWWTNSVSTQDAEAIERGKNYCRSYLDLNEDRDQELHWTFVRVLMASVANITVLPMQDLMGLGSEARMNTPGKGQDNWTWRFTADMLTPELVERLKSLTETYGR